MLSTNIGETLTMQMERNATFTLLRITYRYSLEWIISMHAKDKVIKLVHDDRRKGFVKLSRPLRTQKA